MTRIEKLSGWLQEQGYAMAFVHSPSNVLYLSGFNCHPHERLLGIAVFPGSPPIMVCPALEVGRVSQAGWEHQIIAPSDTDDPWELLRPHLQKFAPKAKAIALETDQLAYDRALALLNIFPGARIGSVQDELNNLRKIKSPQEAEYMRQAAKLADLGIKIGIQSLQESVTEMEVVAEIEYQLKKAGAGKMSFSTIVLFGANSADPHGEPGATKLRPGDFALFDLGVMYKGYCSDITRTFAFKTISPRQREIYAAVLEAQLSTLAICKPGTVIADVDKKAHDTIEAAGFGLFFPHRIGHGLGIDVHEFPSLHSLNQGLLEPGMAFTVEPGVYIPGEGGVRIEDDVLITDSGIEILTQFPKDLQIIG